MNQHRNEQVKQGLLKPLLFMLSLMFMGVSVNAKAEHILQSPTKFTINGTVTDNTGLPIIGATVLEVGTTNGTITDIDGKYTLSANSAGKVLFSYIGYVSQTINIKGQKVIDAQLEEDSKLLDEV